MPHQSLTIEPSPVSTDMKSLFVQCHRDAVGALSPILAPFPTLRPFRSIMSMEEGPLAQLWADVSQHKAVRDEFLERVAVPVSWRNSERAVHAFRQACWLSARHWEFKDEVVRYARPFSAQ